MKNFETLIQTWDTNTLEETLAEMKESRQAYERENLFRLPQYKKLNNRIKAVSIELMTR